MTDPLPPAAAGAADVVLRPAVAADAASIAALEVVLFGADAWSVDQVVEELTGYGRRGWVVETAPSGSSTDLGSIQIESADEAPRDGERHGGAAPLHEPSSRGYVIMRTVGDVSDLQRIAVAPNLQRAGLAARLLAAARAGVREEGAERILLEVAEDNAAARAFYAREGFVEIDRRPRYYRHEVDALVLQLELAQ
ncbi:hypothetical protein GCM10011584_20840 [Nocardioides phosphati]|uniref:N-acetyltransferase domain-containing protein n=1 Tax=Nocardioides phosphati TaxID=1867775 RepID=A0ABQ2NCX7_9ACTN|nr:GNAT family N-acetyltransferase [Nocardioides phosphati]GGO90014.1 hypothetical protein GCM10011584_20840 [Nocardioides phosphati]